jgi:undecaprenyl-diphosphatase
VNDILLAILFGLVEGITEFLPVSSTAHIRITQFLCGVSRQDEFWKMFAVVIQIGAILAVVVYFRGRLAKFVRTFPRGEHGGRTWLTHPLTLVMIAFVTTAGPAYLLKKMVDRNLESPWIMGGALVVGGIAMWIIDVLCTRPRLTHVEDMGVLEAVWIGAVQILSAIFPGTSRSMSTIAAGQIFGMSRQAALEFSFFLSIPTMFAPTAKDLKNSLRPAVDPITHLRPPAIHVTGHQWMVLAVGTLVSFIVAWAVIAWFMNWVRHRGFVPFAIYRLLAGAAVLALAGKLLHA